MMCVCVCVCVCVCLYIYLYSYVYIQGNNPAAVAGGQVLRIGVSYKIQKHDSMDGVGVLSARFLVSQEVSCVLCVSFSLQSSRLLSPSLSLFSPPSFSLLSSTLSTSLSSSLSSFLLSLLCLRARALLPSTRESLSTSLSPDHM